MKKGFTLIELLVVIAIIGILAAVTLSSLNVARSKARDATRMQDIRAIQTALEMYYIDNNDYPGVPTYEYCNSEASSCNTGGFRPTADLGLDSYISGGFPQDPAVDGAELYYYYKGPRSVGDCTFADGTYGMIITFETDQAALGVGDSLNSNTRRRCIEGSQI